MPTYYSLGGLSKEPTTPDRLDGWTEVFIYNPTQIQASADVTAYFEDRDPIHISDPVVLDAKKSTVLVMPDGYHPEIFTDAGFWGLKFDSNTTLDIVVIQVVGPLKKMAENTTYKGGVSHLLATGLNREWYFADGLWLNWTAYLKGEIEKAPFPFNELEIYYFLNPGAEETRVDMTLQFRNIEAMTVHFKVPAGRLKTWCNYEKIPYHQPYGVKVIAADEIATTGIRYIYSLKGIEDWGINLHCGMPAEPGPIEG